MPTRHLTIKWIQIFYLKFVNSISLLGLLCSIAWSYLVLALPQPHFACVLSIAMKCFSARKNQIIARTATEDTQKHFHGKITGFPI